MSTFNDEQHICDAIKSILAQTYEDFEFIIINDGSTDNTAELIEQFEDSRIRVFHEKNAGLTTALNIALRKSKGKYVARIDADDVCLPDRFDLQVNFLENHPEVGLIGSYYYTVRPGGSHARRITSPIADKQLRGKLVERGTPFRHSTVMMRREALEEVGYYNEGLRQGQDYELWIRIAKKYELGMVPEFLCLVRRDDRSVTGQRGRLFNVRLHMRLQLKAMNELGYSKAYLRSIVSFAFWRLLPKATIKRVMPSALIDQLEIMFGRDTKFEYISVEQIRSEIPFEVSL